MARERESKLVGKPLRIDANIQGPQKVKVTVDQLPGQPELRHLLVKTTYDGPDSSHRGEQHYIVRITRAGLEQACRWPGSRSVTMSPAEGQMPSEHVTWKVLADGPPLTIEVKHEGRHVEAEGERFARVTHYELGSQGVCQAKVVSAQGDLPERSSHPDRR